MLHREQLDVRIQQTQNQRTMRGPDTFLAKTASKCAPTTKSPAAGVGTRTKRSFRIHGPPVVAIGPGFHVTLDHRAVHRLHESARNWHRPAFVCTNFETKLDTISAARLSAGGQRVFLEPNAGGSSIVSETLSFEVIRAILRSVELLETETQIRYTSQFSKKTDYLIETADQRIGVSVTRAMKFRGVFTHEDAQKLLERKLYGVLCSTENVIEMHSWKKQILHIWVEAAYMVPILQGVFRQTSPALRANTVVVLTVAEDADWIFYSERSIACRQRLHQPEATPTWRGSAQLRMCTAPQEICQKRHRSEELQTRPIGVVRKANSTRDTASSPACGVKMQRFGRTMPATFGNPCPPDVGFCFGDECNAQIARGQQMILTPDTSASWTAEQLHLPGIEDVISSSTAPNAPRLALALCILRSHKSHEVLTAPSGIRSSRRPNVPKGDSFGSSILLSSIGAISMLVLDGKGTLAVRSDAHLCKDASAPRRQSRFVIRSDKAISPLRSLDAGQGSKAMGEHCEYGDWIGSFEQVSQDMDRGIYTAGPVPSHARAGRFWLIPGLGAPKIGDKRARLHPMQESLLIQQIAAVTLVEYMTNVAFIACWRAEFLVRARSEFVVSAVAGRCA